RVLGIAEANRDLALDVERQPFLRPPGHKVHVAADRPQKIAAAAESRVLTPIIDPVLDQLLALLDAIDIFGDPVERMQVAEPPLAVLDVGLDQVALLSRAPVALLAFRQLGGDELCGGALPDFFAEAGHQLVIEPALAN